MRLKVTYTSGTQIRTAIIEGATIQDALRNGARTLRWDSILEILTEDTQSIQGKV